MWYSTWARHGETVLVGWRPQRVEGGVVFPLMLIRAKVKHAVHEMVGPGGEHLMLELPEHLRVLGKDQAVPMVRLKEPRRKPQ